MLYKQSINQANSLLTEFQLANKKITILPQSPIYPIVQAITTVNETGNDEQLYQNSISANIADGTHSEIEEQYKVKLAKILSNIVVTAKNVVNPLVRDILTKIEESRKLKLLSIANLLGNINIVEIPKLLSDDMFLQLISPYKNTPPVELSKYVNLFDLINDTFNQNEIEQLIRTNNVTLDNKLLELLNNNFSNLNFISLNTSNQLSLNDSVLLFFVLQAIDNQTNDKATSINNVDDNYNKVIELKIAIAGYIYREITAIEEYIKDGEITVRGSFLITNNNSSVLNVYGATYRNWLQTKGGSPEAALGYLAKNGNIFNYAKDLDLRTNPHKYLEEYERRLNQAKTLNTLEDVKLTRTITRDYLATYISQLEDVDHITLQNKLSENLQREYYGANQTTMFVTKVVCRTLIIGDEVKNLLLEIDNVLESMENPDMDKAVYLAIIRLTARWLASNFKIVPKVITIIN